MRAPTLSPRRAAALAAGVAAITCLAAGLLRPATPTAPAASVVPVSTSVLACPNPATRASTTSALGLVAPSAGDTEAAGATSAPTGRATLTAQGVKAAPVVTLSAPGTTGNAAPPKGKTHPYLARGEGALAPGVAAGQVTSTTATASRGLLAVACTSPSGDSWFVGGGGSVGRRTTVLLTNSDSTPAVVDIQVFGPDGPVAARGGEGVLVPARQQRIVRLDVLVPGTTRTALHVVSRAGRVSAAVQDIDTKGLIPRGADFVPQSQPPATRVVVPGILGGIPDSHSYLQVVAPGDADAIVNVHLVTDDGTFAPESSAVLEVAAGSVKQVDLAPFLTSSKAAAVLLDSDVPVVAGVRTVLPLSEGGAEQAYTAGTSPMSSPAAFAPVTTDATHKASLLLTAADADGHVTLTVLDPGGGAPTTRALAVPGGHDDAGEPHRPADRRRAGADAVRRFRTGRGRPAPVRTPVGRLHGEHRAVRQRVDDGDGAARTSGPGDGRPRPLGAPGRRRVSRRGRARPGRPARG